MKEIMVKMYQCDHCTFKSEHKYQVEYHEKTCLEEQAWNEYYRRNREEDMDKIARDCVKWAQEDKLLRIMVENDIEKEKVIDRCRDVYYDNVFYDVGWSGWKEDIYNRMYDALFVDENGEYEDERQKEAR